MVMPLIWLLFGSEAAVIDHGDLSEASAELSSWIPSLLAQAARPQTYIDHIGSLMMATGDTPFPVLLTAAADSISSPPRANVDLAV